jgi:hypothetical protein
MLKLSNNIFDKKQKIESSIIMTNIAVFQTENNYSRRKKYSNPYYIDTT